MPHLATDGTPAAVLSLVGGVLHAGRDEPVAAQQVPLQPLVGEETELAFLAIQGRPIVDHLGVDLHLEIRNVTESPETFQFVSKPCGSTACGSSTAPGP